MSNSTHIIGRESGTESPSIPRAMIHKRILEVAEANPAEPMDEIADIVSGASVDLVERVLDDYGDPAESSSEGGDSQTDGAEEVASSIEQVGESEKKATKDAAGPTLDFEDLTEKQSQTLQAIYDRPDATQRELAELFDVTSATINRRLNTIDGFEWTDRQELVTNMIENENDKPEMDEQDRHRTQNSSEAELVERVEALEKQSSSSEPLLSDPVLAHKVVHACITSDQITEEEELQILKAFIKGDGMA